MHAQPVVDIVDESDAYLDSRVQLIYAFGSKQPLPHCVVRSGVVSELLHALSSDASVRAILADPQVAEVAMSGRRWGAALDVRLVQGACSLFLHTGRALSRILNTTIARSEGGCGSGVSGATCSVLGCAALQFAVILVEASAP